MTGLGIEYSPCIMCDKSKCSFCELTRYKKPQYELQILTDTDGEPYMVIAKGNQAKYLVELMQKDEVGTATERSDTK
jgi:hypothetical protein